MNADQTCSYEGCDSPVHSTGKCARHYSRDYKRVRASSRPDPLPHVTPDVQPDVDLRTRPQAGRGRPARDEVVYKIRYQLPDGSGSNTKHYSDADVAARWVRSKRLDGTLLFFGRYRIEEDLT